MIFKYKIKTLKMVQILIINKKLMLILIIILILTNSIHQETKLIHKKIFKVLIIVMTVKNRRIKNKVYKNSKMNLTQMLIQNKIPIFILLLIVRECL